MQKLRDKKDLFFAEQVAQQIAHFFRIDLCLILRPVSKLTDKNRVPKRDAVFLYAFCSQ